ncbi:hypothetical protein GOP47_0007151 [Adiantum capillus-veneris]|uniref:DNA mismatch repair protein n=1 Tax=Adiantum capillus-veneris TaxID=13818 RepID=A0A9D4V0Z1_ADICA|nr:hypothetical protein GOP47_0007151 [Adiantum capillus-veneris]
MAPSNGSSKRSSLSKTPQQQRSISSFFATKPPSSSPSRHNKPLLVISASADKTSPSQDSPSKATETPHLNSISGMQRSQGARGSQDSVSPSEGMPSVASSTNISNPHTILGKRLKVYWPLDDAWYEGTVKEYVSPNYLIQYDDGDEEAISLKNEKFEWISCNKELRRRKLRKLSFLQPSFEGESNGLIEDGSQEKGIERNERSTSTQSIEEGHGLEAKAEDCIDGNKSNKDDIGDDDDQDAHTDGDNDSDVGAEWTIKSSAEIEDEDIDFEVEDVEGKRPEKSRKVVKQKHLPAMCKKSSQKANAQKTSAPQGAGPKNALDKLAVIEDTHSTPLQPSDKNSAVCVHLTGEVAERFGQRAAEKLYFLDKDRKDASGNRPDAPNYNPCTLLLPPEFKKGLPAGQRQWWELKSKHMDKVMLFKMGKFYEMFEMDAHVGAQCLDLQYMKGNQPHCGFPEKNFEENAGKLARMGYRVLVVEQVETPGQLEQRNLNSGTKDKVVKREVCGIITKGTIMEAEMLSCSPDAAYLMTIVELRKAENSDSCTIGLCVLDAATSRFMLGQCSDDLSRSRLRSLLSELRPVELVKPVGLLSEATEKALREETRNPLVTSLTPGSEFWDADRTIQELALFFGGKAEKCAIRDDEASFEDGLLALPEFLQILAHSGNKAKASLSALGGCISYLRRALLDRRLLSSGRFEFLPGSDFYLESPLKNNASLKILPMNIFVDDQEPYMVLDSSALENLEILESSHDGSPRGSLFAQLDHCVTAFGRRLLRQWIVRPLLRLDAIVDRQNAVEDLKDIAAEAAAKFRKDLANLPDMERLVVRLKACNEKTGRNANAVVLYEDAAKKLLKEFLSALRGFQTMNEVLAFFARVSGKFRSKRLQSLFGQRKGVQDLPSALKYFEDAFDWLDAEKNGHITPHHGVDEEFDLISENVARIEAEMETYLEEQKNYFNNQSIAFVTVGKDRYQLEIPDSLQAKVPHDFNVESQKKGVRRYSTSTIKKLLAELVLEEACKEAALKNILQGLLAHFCENYPSWLFVVQSVAELDALISLNLASNSLLGVACKPIMDNMKGPSNSLAPFILAKDLRHPILEGSLDGGRYFVPNDVKLGGEACAPFMLLTGPNMGGKSTLLRQVCLAVVLAQVGAHVPAKQFHFSPIDRIFVRMGAKDHIMAAQSTFFVELLETSSMLISATRHSLVALDELGRGTATSDGQAIAHAVLEHLVHNVGCLGMFSTHYHRLADEHAKDSQVALHHMACKVEHDDAVEKVTFLYKLASGACPKSYGVNVARIAGMPESVLKRAAVRAAELESLESTHAIKGCEEKLFVEVLRVAEKADFADLDTVLDLHKQSRSMHKQLSRLQKC